MLDSDSILRSARSVLRRAGVEDDDIHIKAQTKYSIGQREVRVTVLVNLRHPPPDMLRLSQRIEAQLTEVTNGPRLAVRIVVFMRVGAIDPSPLRPNIDDLPWADTEPSRVD